MHIQEMLTPEAVEALNAIVVKVDADSPTTPKQRPTHVACFSCDEVTETRKALALEVEEGSEPLFVCKTCKDKRVRLAIRDQERVENIRRPQVAKHQPRITDGVTRAVVITTTEEKKMQQRLLDIEKIPDAEFGALMKRHLREIAEAKMRPSHAAAQAALVAAGEALDVQEKQEARAGHILPSFPVGTTLEVPALDLSTIDDLNTEVPSAVRSVYNKARFRLTGEGPLPALSTAESMGTVPTTYATLEQEHLRLAALSAAHNEGATVVKIEADTPTTDPKVAALMSVLGIDEAEAIQRLASI